MKMLQLSSPPPTINFNFFFFSLFLKMKNCRTEFSPTTCSSSHLLLSRLQFLSYLLFTTTACPTPDQMQPLPPPKATLTPTAIGFAHFILQMTSRHKLQLYTRTINAPSPHKQTSRPFCYGMGAKETFCFPRTLGETKKCPKNFRTILNILKLKWEKKKKKKYGKTEMVKKKKTVWRETLFYFFYFF